jgi:hypothetical protein
MASVLARLSYTVFLLLAPLILAQQQPLPDYALIPYPDSGCTSGSCTPLILVHGIHGTGVDPACAIDAPARSDCNWSPLIDYLKKNDTETWRKTRIYIYRYISDKSHDAWMIGHELRNRIDAQKQIPPNAQLLIVAHSMGGIVARNFMNFIPVGSSVRGYDMTLALVTLATPHHGTPLANLKWRNWTAEKLTYWNPAACVEAVCISPTGRFTSLDKLYWKTQNKSPALAAEAELSESQRPTLGRLRWSFSSSP